jgi:hypothetical protein
MEEDNTPKENAEESKVIPEVIFNTHKFLYSLYHNGEIKGHTLVFTNRNNEEQKIELEKVEIGASPISARFFDTQGNRYVIPFLRVHKVFRGEELVWEGNDADNKNVKVIKGI